jgi:hypothetical protein
VNCYVLSAILDIFSSLSLSQFNSRALLAWETCVNIAKASEDMEHPHHCCLLVRRVNYKAEKSPNSFTEDRYFSDLQYKIHYQSKFGHTYSF